VFLFPGDVGRGKGILMPRDARSTVELAGFYDTVVPHPYARGRGIPIPRSSLPQK
jgi:hypothetical protein